MALERLIHVEDIAGVAGAEITPYPVRSPRIRSGRSILTNICPAPGVFVEREAGAASIKVLRRPVNGSCARIVLQGAIGIDNALVVHDIALIDSPCKGPVCRVGHIQRTGDLRYISAFDGTNFVTCEYAASGRCCARTFLSGLRSECPIVSDYRAIAIR